MELINQQHMDCIHVAGDIATHNWRGNSAQIYWWRKRRALKEGAPKISVKFPHFFRWIIVGLAVILASCPFYAFYYGAWSITLVVLVCYCECMFGFWLILSSLNSQSKISAENKMIVGMIMLLLGCLFLQYLLKETVEKLNI